MLFLATRSLIGSGDGHYQKPFENSACNTMGGTKVWSNLGFNLYSLGFVRIPNDMPNLIRTPCNILSIFERVFGLRSSLDNFNFALI